MKIKFNLSTARYGDGAIYETIATGQCAFELEITRENSVFRQILTLEETEDLRNQISDSIPTYNNFYKPKNIK